MKSSRLFISLIFISLLFVQCQKEEKRTIVNVTVIDKTTDKPIENARVFLIADASSGFMGPSTIGLVEEKRTDKMGQCTFDFSAYHGYGYYCYSSAENYFDQEEDRGSVDFGCVNYVALAMQPVGVIKISVKNTSPFDEFDRLYIDNIVKAGCDGYFIGMNVDTWVIYTTLGNNNTLLNWEVTKNNFTSYYSSKIFVPAIDTTTFIINY